MISALSAQQEAAIDAMLRTEPPRSIFGREFDGSERDAVSSIAALESARVVRLIEDQEHPARLFERLLLL